MNNKDEIIYGVEMKEFDSFLDSLDGPEETKESFNKWFVKSLNIAWEFGYDLGKEVADYFS